MLQNIDILSQMFREALVTREYISMYYYSVFAMRTTALCLPNNGLTYLLNGMAINI